MKKIFVLILALLMPLQIVQSKEGPIGVGNGGGSSEYSVVFAHENLVELLKDCSNFSCSLDMGEHMILNRVTQIAVREKPKVVFTNSATIGNQIYKIELDKALINQDLLWLDQAKTIPFGVSDALALWFEIIADYGGINGPQVQVIGEKIRATLQSSVGRGKYEAPIDLTFEFVKWSRSTQIDLLVIRDPFLNSINVTELIENELACASSQRSISVFSPGWYPLGAPKQTEDVVLALDFGLRTECGMKKRQSNARLIITAVRNKKNELSFDRSSTILQVR